MADKTVNKKTKTKKEDKTPIVLDIDYDKLAKAIATAEKKAENDKKESEQTKRRNYNENLLKKFGYKEGNKLSLYLAKLMTILFVNKKDVEGDETTFAVLQLFVEYILITGEYALYMLCAICLFAFIKPTIIMGENLVLVRIMAICILIPTFLVARLLRFTRFEIEKMEDRDYLNAIAGSFMAIIATILALISFFRG